MRQVLFRVSFDDVWALWVTEPKSGLPLLGAGFVWLALCAAWFGYSLWVSRGKLQAEHKQPLGMGVGGAVVLTVVGVLNLSPFESVPVFGYGTMLLLGFLSALAFARRLAPAAGIDPEILLDAGFWMLLPGIAGGRLAYLVQYGDRVYAGKAGMQLIVATVNLSQGGLVLMGAMAGGAAGYFTFCYLRKIAPLALADVVTPAIFIGIGFGRIGCLLNGCCYGDPCNLPWAVTFGSESVTFAALVADGLVDPSAHATMPLHPTQIYSSINGFILAIVTGLYFSVRQRVGGVFALGCIVYPITRFLIECLRNDEVGRLGTGLTISQIYSLILVTCGIALAWHLSRRGASPPPVKPAESQLAAV